MRLIRVLTFSLILLLVAGALGPPALAEEVIERFVSDLTVNTDSSVTVTETITVRAEGDQIRRGILRDFPTIYRSPDGKRYEVGFDVLSVKRDGIEESWAQETIGNGVRLRIGRADVMLEPGPHTYEIRYRATGELGSFDGYDEIYWNATGNQWTFPILAAEAVIHLPEGATVIQHAAYTGAKGEQGKDFRIVTAEGPLYRAETTRRLAVNEGFTVAVGFTKGVVAMPPPPADTTMLSYEVLGGGVVLLFAYYMGAWLRVGRDPLMGPVVPLWTPPKGPGPAGVRYIHARVFDRKSFAAAMIGLAAKGRVSITHDKDYVIKKLPDKGPALEATEQALFGGMPKTLLVKRENATTLERLWSSLRGAIVAQYDRPVSVKNSKWFWGGVGLSALVIISTLIFSYADVYVAAFLAVFFCGGAAALGFWVALKAVSMFKRSVLVALLLLLIGLPLIIGGLAMAAAFLVNEAGRDFWVYGTGMAAMLAMAIIFAKLLPAMTPEGARLKREVEGLRLYMMAAEEKRLDMLNPPEKTPELFERLLPYAIALDCVNQWSDRFASVLAAESYAGPAWYQGANLLDSSDDFGRSLDNNRYTPSTSSSSFSTSSSDWSPGSSSGSSGGGSSGGGGGGGGGSGW